MMAPQPKVLVVIAQRTIGCVRMEIGIRGSGAVLSRSTNSAPMTSATASSARIGGAVHAKRTPPMFRASMNETLASTIRTAPEMSRRCGRS
jgi:hypothetical protein